MDTLDPVALLLRSLDRDVLVMLLEAGPATEILSVEINGVYHVCPRTLISDELTRRGPVH